MSQRIRNIKVTILSDDWALLRKLTYKYQRDDGVWEQHVRQVYDRGDGVTALLYNKERKSVILTRQFRIPTYENGNPDGHLIETCAGKLDVIDPDECMRREIEEETGLRVSELTRVFELYMSPGSVSEKLYFYTAPYDDSMRISRGGGRADEQENIEVLECTWDQALAMVREGKIRDAKTVLLLQYAELQGLML